jgi:hypothetical protein
VPDIARKKCKVVLESGYCNEEIEVWDEVALAAKERPNMGKTGGNIRRDGKHWISSKEFSVPPDAFLWGRVYVRTFENLAEGDDTYGQAVGA